ncbi:MAG TPA: response regulator [Blastocatellia bacterium]|nr:response regulator [Blastocatellia bacterium]
MNQSLCLLLLEDSRFDADLALTTLAEGGFNCTVTQVETEEDFIAAIERGGYDLILADYSLPLFDGISALEIAQERCPDVPFIFLSGAIGEELAIETLKRGATDYVLKQRLERLVPSVRRALREAEDRRERKRAEQQLSELLRREQVARAEAEAANRAKDIFLATVSHELRTPLNAILGWARLLQAGRLSQAHFDEAIDAISRGAEAQVQLVNDLLDVSRIISGKMSLTVCPIDVAQVIKSALEVVRPAAEAREIQLITEVEQTPGLILGDKGRLQQVFWNLLSNAVKFTPRGGRVETRLRRADSHLEVIVSDNGRGIDPEFLPYVFDPFRQADGSLTRKYGGLGLGLAIVKHLVEMHGGTVRAGSEGPGKGATFIIRLPVSGVCVLPDQNGQASSLNDGSLAAEQGPSLSGVRILAVDDIEDTRKMLQVMLTRYGAEVKVAASVAEALSILDCWLPDVLVSDIGLPNEDGYSLITKVRRLPSGKGGRIPAIALTAHAQSQDRIRALSSGFQLHVPKPVEPAELAAAIDSLKGRR